MHNKYFLSSKGNISIYAPSCTCVLQNATNLNFDKMKKTTKLLMVVLGLWLIPRVANAQKFSGSTFFLKGYPGNTAGIYSGNPNQAWDWIDSARAHVTNLALAGNTHTLTLDPAHTHGTFAIGDHVMVMQMQTGMGKNSGRYEEAIISNITPSGDLEVDRLTNSFVTKSFGCPDCRLQVIKIHRFWQFDLNSGAGIECHAWDGYTGGAILLVARKLVMWGGVMNAAGKGYYVINRSEGVGGAGGLHDTTPNGLGTDTGLRAHFECHVLPIPNPSNEFRGGRGTPGTLPSTGSSAGQIGTSTSGPIVRWPFGFYTFPSSLSLGEMMMGSAGNYTVGKKAANGGEGGGRGGKGGQSATGDPGLMGDFGGNGQNGGNAGKSGRGGGIIMVKADTVQLDPTSIALGLMPGFFYIDGEDGKTGGKGGDGGAGGRGGRGGYGATIGGNYFYNGNQGGFGNHGIGGSGGDGGDGGDCGSILFVQNQAMYCPICPSVFLGMSDYQIFHDLLVSNDDGKGGRAGSGGRKFPKKDPLRHGDSLFPLDTAHHWNCGPPTLNHQGVKDVCDCENAMRFFREFTTLYPFNQLPGPYERWISTKPGAIDTFIFYGHSATTDAYRMERKQRNSSGGGTNYKCKMRGINCERFFDDLMAGNKTYNSTTLDPNNNFETVNQINFWDTKDSFAQYFDLWDHVWVMNTGGPQVICTEWRCNEGIFYHDSDDVVNYGPDGTEGKATSRPDSWWRSGNGTDIKYFGLGAPGPKPLQTNVPDLNNLTAFYKEGNIFVISKQPLSKGTQMALYDMNGKEITRQTINVIQSIINLPVSNISPGVYLLKISNSELGNRSTKIQIN